MKIGYGGMKAVPKKLAELHKNGYRLIIFTNQAGIEKGHTKLDDIKRKCEKLIEETNAPILCLSLQPVKIIFENHQPQCTIFLLKIVIKMSK